MSFSLPDIPDDSPEEVEYPSGEQSQGSDQDSGQNQSPIDQANDLKDKFDNAKSLKEKLSGGGSSSGEAGAAGAEGAAATGAEAGEGAAGAGISTGAGGAAAEGVTAGAAGGTAATGAAGAASAAGTVGATTATGAAAAGTAASAAGISAGAGVAAGATTATGGLAAPLAIPVVVGAAATTKTGRKLLLAGCLGAFGFLLMPLAMAILVIFIFFLPILGGGASGGEAANNGSAGSTNLTISKVATPNLIPKGTANATVTFTIAVTNHTTKVAENVAVSDKFSSVPSEVASFAAEITGYDTSYSIGTIPPGQTSTKNFTVTIPHTDFDPGWVLSNVATVTGTIVGNTETSSSGATIIIGNPPVIPPTGCPMLGAITTPYGKNIPGYAKDQNGNILAHDGVDIGDGVKNNAPVYATITGTLSYANYNSGNNGELTQRIRISNGVYQVEYYHLSPNGKAPEGPITIGQVVGHEDETGFTAGEHLHYEIRVNGVRVNPTTYMSANLFYTQPANDDFAGYQELSPWGRCDVLPQGPTEVAPTPTITDSPYFIFSDSGEKPWTQAEKDTINSTITVPTKSSTWKNLVFGAGKVTLKRSTVDKSCADVCSGFAEGSDTLNLRDKFFTLTSGGKVFVLTHELTHLLQFRSPNIVTDFTNSSAYQEFQAKGVIRSYPLCSALTCQQGLSPFNENFAEVSASYVGDRDGFSVDFPNEYPEQYKFARDKMFGGTSF